MVIYPYAEPSWFIITCASLIFREQQQINLFELSWNKRHSTSILWSQRVISLLGHHRTTTTTATATTTTSTTTMTTTFTFHEDLCPYSIYSLKLYLLFPLAKLGQIFGLPTILCYCLAIFVPTLILYYLPKTNYVTLVRHYPSPDHPHTSAITFGVIVRSVLLGTLLTIGVLFITGQKLQQHFVPLGFYLILLSSFHFSEYFVTSLTNPSTLSLTSFLIDHSIAYILAISFSFIEFILEVYLFHGFKKFNIISMVGLILAISGEIIRKLAMFTAGTNFSHLITSEKDPNHKLVTHGIYSLFRHPSYAGWLYWAVGTQILLLNPICTLLFAAMSYRFFKDRIRYEEETLIGFFNEDYKAYKQKVGLWMPISVWSSTNELKILQLKRKVTR